jgi:hypothetical protein
MEQADTLHRPTGEDLAIRSEMEKMVGTYDAYMRKVTLGRERRLRDLRVDPPRDGPGRARSRVG